MSPPTLCSLCISSTSTTFLCLYNDNAQFNETYHVAVKYFDSMLLRPGKYRTSSSSVICLECWQHINDFHRFQQTVINNQSQLEYFEPIVQLTKLEQQMQTEIMGSGQVKPLIKIDEDLRKKTNPTVKHVSIRVKHDAFIAKCKGKLKCVECMEIFETYSMLSKHFRLEHPEKECYSYCCKLKFNKKQQLMAHLREFHNQMKEMPGTYECELCTESFTQKILLNRHNRYVHKRGDRQSLKCDICKRQFSRAFSLRRHIQLVHKKQVRQWCCPACNRKFRYEGNFEKHKQGKHKLQSNVEIPTIQNEPTEEGLCVKNQSLTKMNSLLYDHSDLVASIEHEQQSEKPFDSIPTDDFMSEDQTIDITEPNEFLLCSENPQNNIQMPPLDIKDELSLAYDSDSTNYSTIGPAENNTTSSPLNDTKKKYMYNFKINRQKKETEQDAFIAKHKGDLECPFCKGVMFANYGLLKRHFRIDHKGGNCYINCCQTKLISRFRIIEHLQFHIDPKAYPCDVCGKYFSNINSVILHKQLVHLEKQTSSDHDICSCKNSKELYAKYKLVCCQLKQRILKDDATIAKWNSELFCRLCNGKFSSYSLLRDHFGTNHPKENLYINCCQRRFYKLFDFLYHIRIHLTPNAIKCEICNEYFTDKTSLVNHMSTTHKDLPRSASMETKLNSNETDETETEIDGLPNKPIDIPKGIIDITEEMSHNIDKLRRMKFDDLMISKWKGRLDCIVCKETFATYSLLSQHFSANHPDEEVHIVCCNHTFTKRSKIVEHIRKYHNHVKNLHKCKMCKATFPQYAKLRRHYLQAHHLRNKYEFKCETCGAGFKQHTYLKKHILKMHSEKNLSRWLCQQCNRSFQFKISLENHIKRLHANEEKSLNNDQNSTSECVPEISSCSNDTNDVTHVDVDIKPEIACDLLEHSNISATEFILEYISANENQTKDITEPNEFLLCSEIRNPQNEIQMPPLDIKDELPLEYDSDPTIEPALVDANSMKNGNSQIHKEKKELKYDAFIAKHKGDLECPLCKGVMYGNFGLLREHFRNEHNGEKCYIYCCQLKLISRFHITEHLQFHIDPKAYQCDVCGNCFKNTSAVVLHKQLVHLEKQTSSDHDICSCKKSNELYAKYKLVCCQLKQRMLKDDATIAQWSSELFCRLCNGKYSSYSLLRDHFCSHHPQENFYIDCCQRKFYKIVDFLYHIRVHLASNANIKCEICNEYLKDKSSLVNHMSTTHKDLQTNEPTHIPEEINVAKEISYNIDKRRRLEFDEYITTWKGHLDCVVCKETYATYSLLMQHFSANHPDQEAHIVCCKLKLTKRSKIVEHIRKYHDHD